MSKSIEELIVRSIDDTFIHLKRTMVFPNARRFQDLFSSWEPVDFTAKPRYMAGVAYSWYVAEGGTCRLSTYCGVRGLSHSGLDVVPHPDTIAAVGANMLLARDYTINFQITIRDNGVALVSAHHSEILSDTWFAFIDAATIPGHKIETVQIKPSGQAVLTGFTPLGKRMSITNNGPDPVTITTEQALTNKLELRTEEVCQMERDIEDLKRLVKKHAQRSRDLAKAARRYKTNACNEHTRADEAALDLTREVGREKAAARDTIARYLEHSARVEIGTVLTKEGREIVGIIASWVRNGLDLQWEQDRLIALGKTDPRAFWFGNSWEERIITQGGHTPVCEAMHYADAACSCGRDGWEEKQLKLAEEAKLNEEAMKTNEARKMSINHGARGTAEEDFKHGVYQHYKGGLYRVLGVGWINEVLDPRVRAVFYVSLTTGDFHARPFADERFDSFTDLVELNGRMVPRFQYVGVQEIPT